MFLVRLFLGNDASRAVKRAGSGDHVRHADARIMERVLIRVETLFGF
jgi:hypothetical protein